MEKVTVMETDTEAGMKADTYCRQRQEKTVTVCVYPFYPAHLCVSLLLLSVSVLLIRTVHWCLITHFFNILS